MSTNRATMPKAMGTKSRKTETAGKDVDRMREQENRERLFALLETRGRERGQTLKDVARALDMTYSYFLALKAGHHSLFGSYRFLHSAARYLERPLAEVLMLGGAISLEDFSYKGSLTEQVDLVYLRMNEDVRVRAILPTLKEWSRLPASAKLTITALYQALFNRQFAGAASGDEAQALQMLLQPLAEPPPANPKAAAGRRSA